MHVTRFRIRTLMIAVGVVALECALAAYALGLYFERLGPNPIPPKGWRWVFQAFLLMNVIYVLPAVLLVRHLWKFTSRLFRACDAAARRGGAH